MNVSDYAGLKEAVTNLVDNDETPNFYSLNELKTKLPELQSSLESLFAPQLMPKSLSARLRSLTMLNSLDIATTIHLLQHGYLINNKKTYIKLSPNTNNLLIKIDISLSISEIKSAKTEQTIPCKTNFFAKLKFDGKNNYIANLEHLEISLNKEIDAFFIKPKLTEEYIATECIYLNLLFKKLVSKERLKFIAKQNPLKLLNSYKNFHEKSSPNLLADLPNKIDRVLTNKPTWILLEHYPIYSIDGDRKMISKICFETFSALPNELKKQTKSRIKILKKLEEECSETLNEEARLNLIKEIRNPILTWILIKRVSTYISKKNEEQFYLESIRNIISPKHNLEKTRKLIRIINSRIKEHSSIEIFNKNEIESIITNDNLLELFAITLCLKSKDIFDKNIFKYLKNLPAYQLEALTFLIKPLSNRMDKKLFELLIKCENIQPIVDTKERIYTENNKSQLSQEEFAKIVKNQLTRERFKSTLFSSYENNIMTDITVVLENEEQKWMQSTKQLPTPLGGYTPF